MNFLRHIEALVNFVIQVFIIFPYSALTTKRLRTLPQTVTSPVSSSRDKKGATQQLARPHSNHEPPRPISYTMISDGTYELCTGSDTVSSLLAEDPTMAPGDAWEKLYGDFASGESEKEGQKIVRACRDDINPEDIKRALKCGNWGPKQPSELFLKMYHDALCTLDKNISGCMVSPPLMGSCGVIPLTIISVVPDIMRHMSNLIVRAEKEVILATNYWQNSIASKYITNAMKELSRRAGERGDKIVFKLEYDRGSAKQLFENHYIVPEKEYLGKAVAIPAQHEIPNIDLQVINYHRPMLGTFHCKYMIVDRKAAVLQSNNIQDNDNLEMMTHLEGPIVDSLYDMALISWHKKLEPPLPSHNSPAIAGGLRNSGHNSGHNEILAENGSVKGRSTVEESGKIADQGSYPDKPRPTTQSTPEAMHSLTGPSETGSVIPPANEVTSSTSGISDPAARETSLKEQETGDDIHHGFEDKDLGKGEVLLENARVAATTGDFDEIVHHKNGLFGNMLKNARTGSPSTASGNASAANGHHHHGTNAPDSVTQEFLESGGQALPQSQIEQPSSTSHTLSEHTATAPNYDKDIAGEVLRVQMAVSPKEGESRMEAVTRHLNHTKNPGFAGTAPECPPGEEFTPYIPHAVDETFPIAMVCREPYGTPKNNSVYNPQNEVWLAALRYAKKNVFIQSPTLNAEPLLPAIIAACERGVDVYCYICLGYNDTGELLPMQGGQNEMIAHHLYTNLSEAGKSHLHYFWYVAKDQTVPIVAKKKKRCCHVKVMIVDEHIGIQGNGNQDTQSWFHSQEINVMFDSKDVCKAWIDGLRRVQNTHLYGGLGKEDGIWRDEEGCEAEDSMGIDPGRFSWAKGLVGAVNRVRGVGDF